MSGPYRKFKIIEIEEQRPGYSVFSATLVDDATGLPVPHEEVLEAFDSLSATGICVKARDDRQGYRYGTIVGLTAWRVVVQDRDTEELLSIPRPQFFSLFVID